MQGKAGKSGRLGFKSSSADSEPRVPTSTSGCQDPIGSEGRQLHSKVPSVQTSRSPPPKQRCFLKGQSAPHPCSPLSRMLGIQQALNGEEQIGGNR